MERRLISSGSPFEAEIAYSRALVVGDWILVSGTTGFDYDAMTIAPDIESQTERALRNIEQALLKAGATLRDVVRVRYLLPDPSEFSRCWPALRAAFGETRPAATMLGATLMDPRMRIEIEADAHRPPSG